MDLSGNTVWPQASGFQKLAKMDHVNVARFARNVEWHFFCDFQTLCRIVQRFIRRFELTMKAIDPSSMFFIVTNSKNARDKISRKYYTDFLYPFGLTKTVYYLPSSQSKIPFLYYG